MVAYKKSKHIEKLQEILRDQNGLLLTSDLLTSGIPRSYLSTLEKTGEIQRISRGVYSTPDSIADEMAGIQARFRVAIFSHATAAYLLELSDRVPLFYSMTVPAGYNATSLKANGVKVYFVRRDLFQWGTTVMKSPHGNDIRAFNLERTLCDMVRSRNQMDIQLVNDALKRYVQKKEMNLDLLFDYARKFNIQRIIREYIEVLL